MPAFRVPTKYYFVGCPFRVPTKYYFIGCPFAGMTNRERRSYAVLNFHPTGFAKHIIAFSLRVALATELFYIRKMASEPIFPKLTAEEFLEIEFPSDRRFELDRGVIRAMGGGTVAHSRVQANLFGALFVGLQASKCNAFGPDMGVRTGASSIRYPDISVYCGDQTSSENDEEKALDDPMILIEVLSPSTRKEDESTKLAEYRALPSVQAIIFVDPAAEAFRLIERLDEDSWRDSLIRNGSDLILSALGLTIPYAEIFAR